MRPAIGMLISTPIGVFLGTLVMAIFDLDLGAKQIIEVLLTYTIVGTIFGWISAFAIGAPIYLLYIKKVSRSEPQ